MKIIELKNKIVGKKLLNVIQLDVTPEINRIVRAITGYDYGENIEQLQLLVFEDKIQLLYSDFDCDGYRSGEWFLSILQDILDKGATKEIKNINSIVRDIIYLEDKSMYERHYFMITTDDYIITLGQDNVSDYYPSNFFNIEECKEKAISDLKIIQGENIEKKGETD